MKTIYVLINPPIVCNIPGLKFNDVVVKNTKMSRVKIESYWQVPMLFRLIREYGLNKENIEFSIKLVNHFSKNASCYMYTKSFTKSGLITCFHPKDNRLHFTDLGYQLLLLESLDGKKSQILLYECGVNSDLDLCKLESFEKLVFKSDSLIFDRNDFHLSVREHNCTVSYGSIIETTHDFRRLILEDKSEKLNEVTSE